MKILFIFRRYLLGKFQQLPSQIRDTVIAVAVEGNVCHFCVTVFVWKRLGIGQPGAYPDNLLGTLGRF